jgi:N-acetylmuramoyl-L-alanine amidase
MNASMTMARQTGNVMNAELAKVAEHAKKILLCGFRGFCVLCVLYSSSAAAAPPVRTMYTQALAQEQTVRAALAASDAAPSLLTDVHAVVAAYEAVVRRYPASGYSDNALWQAGRLALDAFARFGQAADRDTGVRLLRRLAAAYPTSKLAAQVPEQIAPLIVEADAADRSKDRSLRTSGVVAGSAVGGGAGLQGGSGGVSVGVGAGLQASPRAGPTATSRLVTIREIRRAVLPDAVRITIELDGEVPFHEERIPDPARVFVDLPGTRAAPTLVDRTLRFNADADIVRQVRIGRHPNNKTRVVLDAAGVTSYSIYPLYSPYRLVIDCVRSAVAADVPKPPQLAPGPAALAARSLTKEWPRRLPATTPRATALIADAYAAADPPAAQKIVEATPTPPAPRPSAAPATEPAVPVAPPARNMNGGLSMARQLGLGVSRIVIDAGHGGHDPGAKGKGVTEAELVLDVALRLEKLLQKVPGVEVILTRRTDEFIALPERTALANREGADLFLSIHANASPHPQARGIETYFLNFANNVSAAAVAARENAASTLAMGELPDVVKAIAMNNKVDESRDFATHVQRAMAERLRTSNKTLKDLGVKQAPFVVLIGATMPAVLAEISFVTNPQEAKLLKSNAYRQRIADALFNAIKKYQTSLKAAPTVALQ